MKAVQILLLFFIFAAQVHGEPFRSDSKRYGNPKMDIVITEVARHERTSVLDIEVNAIGSSVGSSFFIVCSLRDLARQRGDYRYVAKAEEVPHRGQMLVGFLNGPNDEPEKLDARLAGQRVFELEQFAMICDSMGKEK